MPNMSWIEVVKAELSERANFVSEFAITDENVKKEIAKRKNLDSTGNRWYTIPLVEKIRTSTESIKEGIHRPLRGYSNDS